MRNTKKKSITIKRKPQATASATLIKKKKKVKLTKKDKATKRQMSVKNGKNSHANENDDTVCREAQERSAEKTAQAKHGNEIVHGRYPHWGAKFIALFPKFKTITHTAQKMGISRDAVTRYKRHCKKFREDFYNAKEAITDLIEESAINRSIDGIEKLVLYEGKPVYVKLPGMEEQMPLYEKKYETSLTIFMLKGRRPEEYYPEMQHGGGTTDDQANALLQTIAEIRNVMAPQGV